MLQYGFKPNYRIWVHHGEHGSNEDNLCHALSNYDDMNYVDKFGSINDMLYDAYMQVSDIRLRYENLDYDNIFEEQSPNAFAHKFYDMLASANDQFMKEQQSQNYQ